MGGYALGLFERDYKTGLEYLRRALALNPSAARAQSFAEWLLLYMGRSDEALEHFNRALELCPLDEFAFRMLTGRAFARLFRGEFEAAVENSRRAYAAARSYTVCHRVLAAALAHLDRRKEARDVLKQLLLNNPNFSIARFRKETRFENADDRKVLFDGLEVAAKKPN